MKVISIMGHGHSGSTVLGLVLGGHRDFECVGELHKLPRSGWTRDEARRCACGVPVHECEHWTDVYRRWIDRVGGDGLERYLGLQNRFERSRWSWPRLLVEGPRRSSSFLVYSKMTAALYEAISDVNGKSVVVDTSKPPIRNYALLLNDDLDTHLIHLIRDGRSAIWSLSKPHRRDVEGGIPRDRLPGPAWRTSLRWALTNLESERVAARAGRAHAVRVTYERLVERPGEILRDIGRLTGEDLSEVDRTLEAGEAFAARHSVGGNRLRMAQRVVLRPDFEWRAKLPSRDGRTFWRISGRVAQRYGYRQ
ncbi:MAG: sulfotransferase [Gaiellaceae bacterium]